MFSAYGTLADIVGYVCIYIYARPIHCLSHLGLHPISPPMYACSSARVHSSNSGGMQTLVPLRHRSESIVLYSGDISCLHWGVDSLCGKLSSAGWSISTLINFNFCLTP